MPPKTNKKVRFSRFVQVKDVPYGGRELEPGFLAREARRRALRIVHGIKVPRRYLDLRYGDGTTLGSKGAYTDMYAARNLWHYAKYGVGMYKKSPGASKGRVVFAPRDDAATRSARLVQMYIDEQAKRNRSRQ